VKPCQWHAELVSRQCSTLSLIYPNSVSSQGSSSYSLLEAGYWSNQQAEVDPYCIFQPSSTDQVAVALLLSRLMQCPFAVKSGGHAAFAGASNIQGGITINFAKLNEIVLSSDKSITSVGPGNTWFDVYKTLEPENVQVIGGRVAAIGVGGLTLGGTDTDLNSSKLYLQR
jgi:FAD/FMN-containing dehydrogenase